MPRVKCSVFSAERSVEVVAEKLRPDTIGTLLG